MKLRINPFIYTQIFRLEKTSDNKIATIPVLNSSDRICFSCFGKMPGSHFVLHNNKKRVYPAFTRKSYSLSPLENQHSYSSDVQQIEIKALIIKANSAQLC